MESFHQLMTELRGGITPQEGSLLRRLASECHDGCIVEVGSFRGKSAIALAFGVRDIEAPAARPEIYCIEPHRPFTGFVASARPMKAAAAGKVAEDDKVDTLAASNAGVDYVVDVMTFTG